MLQNPETKSLLYAYAKWRDTVDKTEGSEKIFGSNAEVSEISRDLRENAELELRILIQDLKKDNPDALREWVDISKERLVRTVDPEREQAQSQKQIARDWKFSKSETGISVRYPHPSQYWGSGLPIFEPEDEDGSL